MLGEEAGAGSGTKRSDAQIPAWDNYWSVKYIQDNKKETGGSSTTEAGLDSDVRDFYRNAGSTNADGVSLREPKAYVLKRQLKEWMDSRRSLVRVGVILLTDQSMIASLLEQDPK